MRLRRNVAVVLLVSIPGLIACRESIRGELARLQKQTGITLAWYYTGVNTVHFADRSVSIDKGRPPAKHENGLLSPDLSEIAFPTYGPKYLDQPVLTVVRRDGTAVAEYPELANGLAVCWSHDKSRLVVRAKTADTRPPQYHLFVLDLASHAARQFGESGSVATPQCWSPDDKKLVFSVNDEILKYDLSQAKTRLVAQGWQPTWSPDGQWIAFSRKDGYYSISPAGSVARLLFKTTHARGEFFWSPDSRFVAYLAEGGTFWETLKVLDVGMVQLRVRRLSDGSEDWVWQTPDVPPAQSLQFVWANLPNNNAVSPDTTHD